jgi:hypothetical protein
VSRIYPISSHYELIVLLIFFQDELYNEESFLKLMKSLTAQIVSDKDTLIGTKPPYDGHRDEDMLDEDTEPTDERDRFKHVAAMRQRRARFQKSLAKEDRNIPTISLSSAVSNMPSFSDQSPIEKHAPPPPVTRMNRDTSEFLMSPQQYLPTAPNKVHTHFPRT